MLLIVTATQREMDAVLPALLSSRHPVEALVCGVGPVRAALEIGLALGSLPQRPLGVVNLGVAGVFDDVADMPGGPAVASAEVWPEYGLRSGLEVDARALGFPLLDGGHGTVWDRIELEPDETAGKLGLVLPAEWPRWPSLTVAGVTASFEDAERMAARHAVRLENMEGFALALACARTGIPFLEVRAVSNVVGERDKTRWRLDAALGALGRAAEILFGVGS